MNHLKPKDYKIPKNEFTPSEELKSRMLKDSYSSTTGFSTFYLEVEKDSELHKEIKEWIKSQSKINIGGLYEVSPAEYYEEVGKVIYGFKAYYYLREEIEKSFKNIPHKTMLLSFHSVSIM